MTRTMTMMTMTRRRFSQVYTEQTVSKATGPQCQVRTHGAVPSGSPLSHAQRPVHAGRFRLLARRRISAGMALPTVSLSRDLWPHDMCRES
jgi:hypothetical protein